jgi:hypothetical protein
MVASTTNAARENYLDREQDIAGLTTGLFAAIAALGRGYYPLGYQPKRSLRQTSLLFAGRRKKADDVAHFLVDIHTPVLGEAKVAAAAATQNQRERNKKMSKRKNPPNEPFRRSQVVSPVPSGRRFGKAKFEKQTFDVYLTDIETGDETLAITVFAPTQREAIQMAKKRLQSSPVLRGITHAAYTAVKVDE